MASERASWVATFVGGGLTLLTAAAAGLGAARGIWIGAALAGVVAFAVAGWLHTHPEAAAGPAADLVPPNHLHELRNRLEDLTDRVNGEEVCDFGDPPKRRQLNREAMAAHFPTLVSKLEEWNRAISAKTCARHRLRTRLLPAVANIDIDIDISPEESEAIAESLADTHPRPILENQWQLLSTGIGFIATDTPSGTMVRLPGPTSRLAQDQFARLLTRIRAINLEAEEWNEGRDLRAANQALAKLPRDELLDELRAAHFRHSVPLSSACPACAGALPDQSTGL